MLETITYNNIIVFIKLHYSNSYLYFQFYTKIFFLLEMDQPKYKILVADEKGEVNVCTEEHY